jgi:hypothetical protein
MTLNRNLANLASAVVSTGGNLATANLSGTITSSQINDITSSQVTTALGFTPYNSTNPSGYITSAGAPVTSVNGQTGAVVTTSLNSIGCTQFLYSAYTGGFIYSGATISGSNLYYITGLNSTAYGYYLEGSASSSPNIVRSTIISSQVVGSFTAGRPGNNGYSVPASNISAVSGTWRLMSGFLPQATSSYNGCCGNNYTGSNLYGAVFVRVS